MSKKKHRKPSSVGTDRPTETTQLETEPRRLTEDAPPEIEKVEQARAVVSEPVPGASYKVNIVQPDKANPSLEMTWCLSPEFLYKLAEELVFNPFILILVVKDKPYTKEVERKLVPLKQGGVRLEFYEPGSFTLYTAIVKADQKHDSIGQSVAGLALEPLVSSNRKIFEDGLPCMKNIRGEYCDYYRDEDRVRPLVENFEKYTVNIDPSFFAPDPPKWLQWWVNLWFEGKEKNECHLRRRLIPAFTIQPPMVLLWILLRAVCGVVYTLMLALIGWRWISLVPIFRPFALDLKDINANWSECSLGMSGGYWTIGRKSGKEFEKYPTLLRVLFTPFVWVGVGLIAYFLVFRYPEAGIVTAKVLAVVVGVVLMTFPLIFFAMYLKEMCDVTASKREEVEEVRKATEVQVKIERSREKIKREFVELTCGAGGPSDGHLSSLPPRHQTFYTRFEALKGRVCRPYAKGY